MQKFVVSKPLKLTRQLRSWLLISMIVLANITALYSAVLAAGDPSGPPTPTVTQKNEPIDEPVDNPEPPTSNTKPPNNPVNNIPELGQPGSPEETGQQLADQLGAKSNLITQYAEQEANDPIVNSPNTPARAKDINNLVNNYSTQTALAVTPSLIALQDQMNSINGNLAIINANPNTGSTLGWSQPIFEAIQAVFYYTIGGGWLPRLGWIVGKYIEDFVAKWMGPA